MNKFVAFFLKPRNLFIIGFILTFGLTLSEVLRGKQFNFIIFSKSTIDFWNGVCPYGADWAAATHDFFLYMPPFSVLFTPFAFLPDWMGPFVWNLFNFTMYFLAIFSLPNRYTKEQKSKTFLFTLLILATTQLSFQYNAVVAYLAVFAFSLLERGKSFWAILLILISGYTKVYGIFQLGMLLFYPKFWQNMGYVVILSVVILASPLLKLSADELIPYYQKWLTTVLEHNDTRPFYTVFHVKPFGAFLYQYMMFIQAGTITLLAGLLISCRKKFSDFNFRAGALGILMGWTILFSNSSERHTYLIALLGYLIWYWVNAVKGKQVSVIDKVLFWSNFVVLVVMPVDLLCPTPVMKFFFDVLTLNLWLFIFTWLRMCYLTFIRR